MAAVHELFKQLEKEAQCPVCLGTVSDPKTLPCLHSFCLNCLQSLQNRRDDDEEEPLSPAEDPSIIGCPVCRMFAEIPDDIANFPTSFHLNRLVDILDRKDASSEAQMCISCKKNVIATCYCFVCLEFMCTACFKAHPRSQRSPPHRNVSIENLRAQQGLGSNYVPSFCSQEQHEMKQRLTFYCQDCRVCICRKCYETSHDTHSMIDIYDQKIANAEAMQMRSVVEKVKQQVLVYENRMDKQTELMEKSKEESLAAQRKVTENVEGLISVLKEHERVVKAKLLEVNEAQQKNCSTQLENFRSIVHQLRSFVEYGEAILNRKLNAEILQAQNCFEKLGEELLHQKKLELFYPQHVDYVVSRQAIVDIQGHVTVKYADASKSRAEGKGLTKAYVGTENNITVTVRDQEGGQFYHQDNQLTVKVINPQGEHLSTQIKDHKDGKYTLSYKPENKGVHTMLTDVNGKALTGSPWNMEVVPHCYHPVVEFGESGKEQGQFDWPVSVAVSNRNRNIAIADCDNSRIQLFDCEGEYLLEFGQNDDDVKKLNQPVSVAFTSSGDIIVLDSCKILQFDLSGHFKNIATSEHLKNPSSISVGHDDELIVCDKGDKTIKILSPNGVRLLKTFSAPDCHTSPEFAICHQSKIFVSYFEENCIKVFDAEGHFLFDIGGERTRTENGTLIGPLGLAVDKYDHLVVCDFQNKGLHIFTLDGMFVSNMRDPFNTVMTPYSVAVSNEGHVVMIDILKHSVQVFQ